MQQLVGQLSSTFLGITAEEEGEIGAKVSLPILKVFFRLFKLLFLSELGICLAHAFPIIPLATGSYAHLAKGQI